MIFYILLLMAVLLDFILEYMYKKNEDNIKNDKLKKIANFIFKYRLITVLPLIFLSTFKADSVGCDTYEYIRWYEIENYRSDLCYSILQLIVFRMGISYRLLWFVISTFVSFVFVVFINEFSENKFMSFILYITLGVFSITLCFMRQIIAIGFLLLEIIALKNKKYKTAILFNIIAILFHRSAFIGILFILFKFVKLNGKMIFFIYFSAIVVSLLLPYIIGLLSKIGYVGYLTKYFIVNTGLLKKNSINSILYTVSLNIIFLVFYIFIRYLKKLDYKENETIYYLLSIYLFSPIIKIMGLLLNANGLFDRLHVYFFIMLIIIIPNCLSKLKSTKKLYHVSNVLCYVIAICFLCYLSYINYYETFPFVFGF